MFNFTFANRKLPRALSSAYRIFLAGAALACWTAFPNQSFAQSNQPAANSGQNNSSQDTIQTKIQPVSTTVVVHGEVLDNYLPESVTVGSLDGASIKTAPLSAAVITRDLLNDQVSRLLSDVIKNDASVGNDYVPVGYYGDYMIRGFPIDLATGLQINGMTIAGEQDVPLENKQSVEVLHGLASVESGVTSGGGLIDYVTKRPANIQAVDLATDHRGTAYGAVDIGHLFGSQKQVGTRFNLAGERMVPYINDTQGWRSMGAGAADWKISSKAVLRGDFEYQHKTERDASGYQLLGGTTLPDINRIFRSTMLGDQSWAPPDTYDTFNTGVRLNYSVAPSWIAFVDGNFSHSLIQDNVMYAYGCYLETDCNSGSAPPYFFAPDGTYDLYDYRNPNELRYDAQAEAMTTGHMRTGAVTQDITAGGTIFMRSVQMPGYYSVADPYSPDGIVQDGAVYTYLGSENIYQPIAPVGAPGTANSPEDPAQTAGPRRLWVDSHQASGVIQDRVHIPGRIQLLASGRYDSLRDHNYSAYASCTDFTVADACLPQPTDKRIWLPQFAVTFNPTESLTLYSNYGELLSLGPQAPFWVDNGSQFLAPYFTRQAEIGAKYEPDQRILLTTAFFHMRAPFFYPKTLAEPNTDTVCPAGAAGDQCFESEGRETHNGVEVSAAGKATTWLRLNASATVMNAVSTNTGTPAYDNKQVIDVPHAQMNVFADLTVPRLRGLHLMPGWNYASRKEATRDDAVSVPSYSLLNLGARYTPGGEQGRVSFHLYADNVTNKKYWSDTGASLGDSFIWLGAPTTVRLAAHYTF